MPPSASPHHPWFPIQKHLVGNTGFVYFLILTMLLIKKQPEVTESRLLYVNFFMVSFYVGSFPMQNHLVGNTGFVYFLILTNLLRETTGNGPEVTKSGPHMYVNRFCWFPSKLIHFQYITIL